VFQQNAGAEKPLWASHCFAFRRQIMTDRSTLGGAAALAIGKIGPLFMTALQRVYAAHMEKAQMRFAPRPVYCDRAMERRRGFDL
jgi:hypothetical protein